MAILFTLRKKIVFNTFEPWSYGDNSRSPGFMFIHGLRGINKTVLVVETLSAKKKPKLLSFAE